MPRNISGLRRGGPGRTKGAKDKLPRTFRGLAAQILEQHPEDFVQALLRGVKDRKNSHRYLAIFAGLEKQLHEHTGAGGGPVRVRFVDA